MTTRGLLLLASGCLSVPSAPNPACKVDSDCATGEQCQESTCWGNPPAGPFVATLAPPASRPDLAAREYQSFDIPQDGNVNDSMTTMLQLEPAKTITGRVEAFCPTGMTCDRSSVAATITITRAPEFAGGRGVDLTVSSMAGLMPDDGDSFTVGVPASDPGDAPFVVTILPAGRTEAPPMDGTAAAQTVPPMRIELTADEIGGSQLFTLGGDTLPVITGSLLDTYGTALRDYRVVARGKFGTDTDTNEVSTIDYSTDGSFSITLAANVVGPVELVASPFADGAVAPTLERMTPPATSNVVLAQPTGLGNQVTVNVAVTGVAGDGSVGPVNGARVIVTGTSTSIIDRSTTAVLTSDVTTGDNGVAMVSVLDGTAFATTYTLSIVPPANSNLGIVFGQAFDATMPTLPQQLGPRLKLVGHTFDSSGAPIANVAVTVAHAPRFTWNLPADPQAFLADIPTSTAVTDATGSFVVYVDSILADVWGVYDFELDPPTGSAYPTWSVLDFEVDHVPVANEPNGKMTVPDTTIPDAAHIHGLVTDTEGDPVPEADLHIYQTRDQSLCTTVLYPPPGCSIPAQVLGSGTADDMGEVRLVLPRP